MKLITSPSRSCPGVCGPLVLFGLSALLSFAGVARGAEALDLATELAEPAALLTNVQQVLNLPAAAIQTNPLPTQLRGVVVYPSIFGNRLYVQDATGGIQVNAKDLPFRAHAGQLVEVEGISALGPFYTCINNATVRLLGTAPLPRPKRTSSARLEAAADFGRRLALKAIIHDMAVAPRFIYLHASSEGAFFSIMINREGDAPLPLHWRGAVVDLTGVSWTFFDGGNRPVGFRFHLPDTNSLAVIQPGGGDLFARPTRSMRDLRARVGEESCVKIEGVVTQSSPAGFLTIQDATGSARAETLQLITHDEPQWRYLNRPPTQPLHPGDRIELVGVPASPRAFAPHLLHAEYRLLGHSALPAPKRVPVEDLMAGNADAELVTFRATLSDRTDRQLRQGVEQTLWLRSGHTLFEAILEGAPTARLPSEPGSELEVIGVCDVQAGALQPVRSVRIHLRDTSDVRLLRTPRSRLNSAVLNTVLTAGVVIAAALGWILMLRARVHQRTAALALANEQLKQAEQELLKALAQEKELSELKSRFVSMVSHEFRTPLAIIMSSAEILDAYLDRLPPAERLANLRDIEEATRHMGKMMDEVLFLSRAEAGKMTCCPSPLDVPGLCERIVNEVHSATNRRCPIEWKGPKSFPEGAGDQALIRHILINLLHNAVKYSAAGSPVELLVEECGRQAVFTVRDRGIGIAEADARQLFQAFHRGRNVGERPGSGLGLMIVKSCVELHHGQIRFESQEGQGSTFVVELPLFGSLLGAEPSPSI